jgi:outer membrane protein OmpA-like peptidoglycan-associated protein
LKAILLTFLTLSLFAQTQELYPFIQPVSVEIAPKQKAKEILPVPKEKEVTEAKKELKTDSDADGILDTADTCANTSKEFIVDASGCPVQAKLQINFALNSYTISDKYENSLKTFAEFLLKNKEIQVLVYGFCDQLENDKESKILSQKRANAVKNKLIQKGVSSTKLTAIGRGEESPIAQNTSETERAKNRRIEIEIIP